MQRNIQETLSVQTVNIVMNRLHFHNMIVAKSARLMKKIFRNLTKIVVLHSGTDEAVNQKGGLKMYDHTVSAESEVKND